MKCLWSPCWWPNEGMRSVSLRKLNRIAQYSTELCSTRFQWTPLYWTILLYRAGASVKFIKEHCHHGTSAEGPQSSVQCAVCSVRCAKGAVCSVYCAVWRVRCAVCSGRCAVCSVSAVWGVEGVGCWSKCQLYSYFCCGWPAAGPKPTLTHNSWGWGRGCWPWLRGFTFPGFPYTGTTVWSIRAATNSPRIQI